MNNLVLKEKQEFMGIEIPVIEGGFGEGQRIVLGKTVAEIHKVEIKYINKLINNNIEKFGVNDLIDCLSSSKELRNFAKENDLIGSNRTQNVFILSQRGYTKLVAMMDNSNDKKWDVMNNLIDDYFNMRNKLSTGQHQIEKKPTSAIDLFESQLLALREVESRVEKVDKKFEDLPLIGAEPEELQAVVQSAGTRALGGYECPAYKDKKLRARVFQSVWKYVKDQFNVRKYKAIKRKHLSKAKEIAENYTAPFYLQEEIDMINNQSQLNI